MMRALSALLFVTASAATASTTSNKLAGVVVGHMKELNLAQDQVFF